MPLDQMPNELPRLSVLAEIADENCPNCNGGGWVCENHPDKEWCSECDCGAGMPCTCNPLHQNATGVAGL